jgi:hypothetical protein
MVPLLTRRGTSSGRFGSTRYHPAHRARVPATPPADHRRAETPRMAGEPQAGGPDHARGQLVVSPEAEVRPDYRFQSQLPDYPNLAAKMTGVDQLGRRHHLHPTGERIRLPGRGVGRILTTGGWLGVGPYLRPDCDRSAANGVPASRSRPRLTHHSDRVQYVPAITELLKEHGVRTVWLWKPLR